MTTAIRSEFLKFFTTRPWWGMAIGIFVAGGLFAGFFGWALTSEASRNRPGAPQGDATQIANTVYTSGMGVGYLLLLTIGVLMIGAEYRHKTITSTFLATPKRLQAMLAKVVALLVIGALYGLISIVSSVGVGATVLKLAGHDPFPSSEVFRTMALSLLVLGLWGLIGLGVGILIKNQVAALLIGHRGGLDRRTVGRAAARLLGLRGRAHRQVPPQPGHECRGQLGHPGRPAGRPARMVGRGCRPRRVCRGARRVRHLADPARGRLLAPPPHADGGFGGVPCPRHTPGLSVRRGRVTTGRTLRVGRRAQGPVEIGWTDHPSPTTQ